MKETWKRIGDYEVCWWKNKLRSLKFQKCRYLKLQVFRSGYFGLDVIIDGRRYVFFHQLVALAYHGPCSKGLDVHHKDDDKRNNNPTNLEYLTKKEHTKRSMDSGLFEPRTMNKAYGLRNAASKLTPSIVLEIRRLYRTGNWTYVNLGKRYGVGYMTPRAVILGRSWKHIK